MVERVGQIDTTKREGVRLRGSNVSGSPIRPNAKAFGYMVQKF